MSGISAHALKLAVPKTVREVVGAVVGLAVLIAFLVSTIYLAIYDLLHFQGIIPSLIWLSLVGLVIYGMYQAGFRKVAVNILGAFSRKQFIQVINSEGQQNKFQHGYQFFGRHFLYFVVAADKIAQVDWNTGQASSMAGKDMNDWHVALWYVHGDPVKSEKQRRWRHPDWNVYCLGPSGPKKKIDVFGHALVGFLRNSGVPLTQGDSDHSFVCPGSQS